MAGTIRTYEHYRIFVAPLVHMHAASVIELSHADATVSFDDNFCRSACVMKRNGVDTHLMF